MRHGKKFNHLGRKKGHRNAMLKNMACSLIEHKRIRTTLAKGKAIKRFIEPLITKSKTNTTHSRRIVFSYLQNKEALKELFDGIADKVADRSGGYIRVLKTGFRPSDAADMCLVEFVDYNTDALDSQNPGYRRTRRGRRKKKQQDVAVAEDTTAEETPTEE